MALYAIGDLHLCLGAEKPMDIFGGAWVGYMDKLKQGLSVVKPEDTLVLLGDLSWALELSQATADFAWINEIPGRKIILKGNHDYWWNTAKKMENFFKENGLHSLSIIHNNSVCVEDKLLCGTRGWIYDDKKMTQNDLKVLKREAMRLEASITSGLAENIEPIVFLHYPPVFDGIRCDEIMDVIHKYSVHKVYYGHIHGHAHSLAVNGVYEDVEFRLVSCDYTDFSPILVR